jgi:hypothetical protein
MSSSSIPKYLRNKFLKTTESTEDTEIREQGHSPSVLSAFSVVLMSRSSHSTPSCFFILRIPGDFNVNVCVPNYNFSKLCIYLLENSLNHGIDSEVKVCGCILESMH